MNIVEEMLDYIFQQGPSSRVQIDECKVGYCDYKGNTQSHLNLYCDL